MGCREIIAHREKAFTDKSGTSQPGKTFPLSYERKVRPGVGHFVPRENPKAVIYAILRLDKSIAVTED